MSDNGSGEFSIGTDGYPIVYGDIGTETFMNQVLAEIAAGLTNRICRDGQSVISQNIPFNAKRITNLGTASALLDAANIYNVLTNTAGNCTTVGGTANAITLQTLVTSTLTAYATGLQLWFAPTAANTAAVTVDVNSLGAKDLTKIGAVALAPGDLQIGALACIVYDGTRFQLVTPPINETTWLPSVGGTATYTTQIGRASKVGRTCHFVGDMTINAIGTGSTSVISGLPYPAANVMDAPVTIGTFASLASTVVWIGGNVVINTSTIQLRHLTAAGAAPVATAILGNSSRILVSGSYQIAL